MKNTLAFQAYSQKENLTLELCFSLRAPCKEKTSELWSFEREEALRKKKKLEGTMQMRENVSGKIRGAQWCCDERLSVEMVTIEVHYSGVLQ